VHYSPFIRLSLAGAIALAPVARAQGPTRLSGAIDLGALVQREGVDLWQGATRLAPSLRLDQRFARMSLDGSIVGSGQSVMLNHGTLDAALSPAPVGPLRLSVGGRAERLASSLYSPRTVLTVESSLSLTAGAGGAWLGAAMERSPQVDSAGAQPLLRAGLWRQIGGAVITISTSSRAARLGGKPATTHTVYYPDSVFVSSDTGKGWNHFLQARTFGDSGQASRTKLWSEVEIGASWAHGPVALDAAFGARPAVDAFPRAFWGRLSAAVQATPGVAFFASAGNDPARITIGTPQTRVVTLGLRLSRLSLQRPTRALPVRPTAAAFSLRPMGANTYVVSIYVPRARTVELSGDFGRWKPLALYETSPDVWETTLTLPPGTYRMNLRIDGDQWRAPPGMAAVADEFNGTVGIIAVR
jgi:Glycogen recognition site of AMP-activated protein kinase